MASDNEYRLVSCGRRIVAGSKGGRIKAFCLNGKNALLAEGVETGSTFWPSPQALWGWPPPHHLDKSHYENIVHNSEKIQLRSAVDEQLGIRVIKTITPIYNGFNVEYSIINEGGEIVTMAPWEISRVSGGLTFYCAQGRPEPHSSCPAEYAEGHYWYDYQARLLRGIPKIFANHTEGWLANVNNGLLLVKKFPCVDRHEVAPSEAEIEIYAHADPANPYIELEEQGPFKAILPGMKNNWSVDWMLFEVPDYIHIAVGSRSLLEFASDSVVANLKSVV